MTAPSVLIYARQSVSDGDDEDERENTLSLQSQRATLARWATEQGWRIVGEITDADQKGYDDQRPGFLELLRRCREGGVSHVAVWSLDRLARSVRITENLLHELAALGVEVVSYKEPWVSQPMFRQILAAVGEEQTRTISAHIRRALAERGRQGLPHSFAPWGYARGEKGGSFVIDPDHPERAEWLRQMFAWRAAGHSVRAIAIALTAAGVPTARGAHGWDGSAVRVMLANPTYRGAVVSGGAVIEGRHPAIVDPDCWQRAQHPFGEGQRSPRAKTAVSWLEGHIRHECGQRMYLARSGADGRRLFRCRYASANQGRAGTPICAITPRTVAATRIEEAAWREITGALAALLSAERVIANAHRAHQAGQDDAGTRRRAALSRIAAVESRRAKAEELYLSGSRDRAWFDAQEVRLAIEVEAAHAELASLPMPPDPEQIQGTWRDLRDVRAIAARIAPEDRRTVLAALGTIVVMGGGKALGSGQAGIVQLEVAPHLRLFFRDDAVR